MTVEVNRTKEDRAADLVNAVLGVVLLATPWVAGFAGETAAAWNASLVGAAIAAIAVGALVAFRQWVEWANLLLGLWAIVAPWALGFASVAAATYAHVGVGVIVAALAALELWRVNRRSVSSA